MSDPSKNPNSKSGPLTALRRVLAMPNDSTPKKILLVAVALCLVCSVVVSSAAVLLKPIQIKNKALDRQRNILQAAGRYRPEIPVAGQFEDIETRLVDLATGEYVEGVDSGQFDQREAARDPQRSVELSDEEDIAGIGRRAQYAKVYLVNNNGRLDKVILPVHGYGLWSTMYGFLALEEDANTVYGLRFYDHAETPGLGGEVDNPKWRNEWRGKKVFDDDGEVAIEVAKGTVPDDHPQTEHRVDGLSGATLTSRGVTNLLRYWLSDQGFRPYLDRIRKSTG